MYKPGLAGFMVIGFLLLIRLSGSWPTRSLPLDDSSGVTSMAATVAGFYGSDSAGTFVTGVAGRVDEQPDLARLQPTCCGHAGL